MKVRNIKTPDNKKDHMGQSRFIKDCFSLDFPLGKGNKNPTQPQAIKDVPSLVKKNSLIKAWDILDAHQDEFSDLDFIYVWQAVILQKNGQINEAEETLDTGLKKAQQKHVLCYRMGDLKYQTKDMASAIKWWVRSIEVMFKTQTVTIWEPFLYMAYIAKGNENENYFSILMKQVSNISVPGELQLEKEAQENLNQMLTVLPQKTISTILDQLCRKFSPDAVSNQSLPPLTQDETKKIISHKPKKRQPAWIFLMIAISIICLSGYLFFSKRTSVSQEPVIFAEKVIEVENIKKEDIKQIIQKETAPEENEQTKPNQKTPGHSPQKLPIDILTSKKNFPAPEKPEEIVPEQIPSTKPFHHKEKYPWMKVKTKTANPDIKKKSDPAN